MKKKIGIPERPITVAEGASLENVVERVERWEMRDLLPRRPWMELLLRRPWIVRWWRFRAYPFRLRITESPQGRYREHVRGRDPRRR
jgi:hypothetical protein